MRYVFAQSLVYQRVALGVVALLAAFLVVSGRAAVAADRGGSDTTVRRQLADLGCSDAAIRKRAVLVLGKYETEAAREALVESLSDPVSDVRRSALVSLVEQGWFPADSTGKVLKLLGDSDVHIRRILSSALPQVLLATPSVGISAPVPTVRQPSMVLADKALRELLSEAFLDSDATVRRNMLRYAGFLPGLPNSRTLRKLLNAQEEDIRIRALEVSRRTLEREEFVELAAGRVDDESPSIRRRLVALLGASASPGAVPLLRKLMDDQDALTAASAVTALLRAGHRVKRETLERVFSGDIDASAQALLVRAAGPLLPEAPDLRAFVLSQLEHSSALCRRTAVDALAQYTNAQPRVDRLLSLLSDPSAKVRRAVQRALTRRGDMSPADLLAMLESTDASVRAQAVRQARELPVEEAREVLMEALLDEAPEVRGAAVNGLATLRAKGVHGILRASLRDPNPTVVQAALRGLLTIRDAQALAILKEYGERTENQALLRGLRTLERPSAPVSTDNKGVGGAP